MQDGIGILNHLKISKEVEMPKALLNVCDNFAYTKLQ